MHLMTLTLVAAATLGITTAKAAEPSNNNQNTQGAQRPASNPNTYVARDKADAVCTNEPQATWLPAEEMKLLATHRGYRIKTFKISKNNCYEIYGFDRQGQIVEAYFNPVTSRLVTQNIAR
jgi:hypothetical protein